MNGTLKRVFVTLAVAGFCLAVSAGAFAAGPVLTDLKGWYKADSLNLNDGDGVAYMQDFAPGQTHYLRSAYDDPNQGPTYRANVINGKPALQFYGDGRALLGNTWGGGDTAYASDQYTYFLVVADWTGGTPLTLANGYAAGYWGDKPAITLDNGNVAARHNSSPGNDAFLDHQNALNAGGSVISAVFGASPTDMALYIDGVASTQSLGISGAPTAFANANRTLLLGQDYYGDFSNYTGYVAEVLIYTRALTDAERLETENYLTAKYAAPVPEPSGLLALGISMVGFAGVVSRRRK